MECLSYIYSAGKIWLWPSSTLTHEEARSINGIAPDAIVGNVIIPSSDESQAIVIHRGKRHRKVESRLMWLIGRGIKHMVRK